MKPARLLLPAILVASAIGLLRWTGGGEQAVLPGAVLPGAGGLARGSSIDGEPQLAGTSTLRTRTETRPASAELVPRAPESPATLQLQFRSAYEGRTVHDVEFQLYVGTSKDPRAERSDGAGAAALEVPASEPLLVWVEGSERHGFAEAEVEALGPGEECRVTIELPTGDDLDWYGRAEWRGAPVSASVTVVGYGKTDRPQVLEELETDTQGQVAIRVPSWRPIDVRFVAPGRGVALLTIESGHGSPADAQVVALRSSGALRALVEDAAGTPMGGVRVVVEANTWDLAPYPAIAAFADDFVVEGETDADGVALLEDLPAGIGLDIRLFVEGRLVRREEAAPPLVPGERSERRYRLGEAGRVVARVLDGRGVPVDNARVWLVRDRWQSVVGYQFDPTAPVKKELTSHTDSAGVAQVTDVPLGAWFVACSDEEVEGTEVVSLARPVVLTAAAPEADVTLALVRGLSLAGRLLDDQGAGIAGQRVFAFGMDFGGSVVARSEEDGSFRLFPLAVGTWSLGIDTEAGWIAPPYAKLPAGREDLEIVLTRGGSIRGVVRDAASGALVEALVIAYAVESDRPNAAVVREFCPDGEFLLEGFSPGRHALVATTEEGRIALLDSVDVEPTAVTGPIELLLEPAVPVRLRYAGPAESCTVLVTQRGATLSYVLLSPGLTESFSAPAGRLEIRVEPESEAPTLLERFVEPGAEVEIVVE